MLSLYKSCKNVTITVGSYVKLPSSIRKILEVSTSGSYNLPTHFFMKLFKHHVEGCGTALCWGMRIPVSYFLHTDQLVPIYYKKKLLWWELWNAIICEYNKMPLQAILIQRPFSRIIILGSIKRPTMYLYSDHFSY